MSVPPSVPPGPPARDRHQIELQHPPVLEGELLADDRPAGSEAGAQPVDAGGVRAEPGDGARR